MLHYTLHRSNWITSFYSSKCQEYPYPHIHFKSNKLKIHEDVEIDERFFSPEYWQNKLESLISSFECGYNTDLGDNQVFVLPKLDQFVDSNNQHYFNLNSIIDGKYYITEEKKLPSLVRKIKCDSLIGFTDKNQILLVDKNDQIRFRPDKIFKLLINNNNLLMPSFEDALNNVIFQLKEKVPTNYT